MGLPGKIMAIGAQQLLGTLKLPAASGTTNNTQVLFMDGNGDTLLAVGKDVPVNTTKGYAKGALFINKTVATGTTGLYCNKGTNLSCVFTAVTQA